MKMIRNRLGLIGAASALALIASGVAPQMAQAEPTPSTASGITVIKALPAGPVANGATVVGTLTINNPGGPTPAVIEDYYDYGFTYVSDDSADCVNTSFSAVDHGKVVCTYAALPAGNTVVNVTYTATYVGPTVFSFWRKSEERMEIQKADNHVSLLEDEQKTVTVSCQPGYHIMDFGFVKQHVDVDEGDYEHIRVVTTDVTSPSSWAVTVKNISTGQAQAKLYATCIRDTTNEGTTLTFDPLQEKTVTLHPQAPDEPRPLYAHCDPGETPIAVDVRAARDLPDHPSGSPYSDGLLVQHGLEADGGQRTRVWIELLEPADVTLEWQCMKTTTSSGRPMQFELVSDSKTVPGGAKANKKLECNVGFKGVIGGWKGGKINGSEPQPIARVFWFYNQTGGPKTYDLTLLCLRNRLLKTNRLVVDTSVVEQLLNYASGVEKVNPTTHRWIAPDEDTINVQY